MLFRRLLEDNSRASVLLAAEGHVVSAVAHAALIGGVLYAARDVKPSDLANSFTPVAYFVPRDRMIGSRPKQERISYVSVRQEAGGATDAPAKVSAPEKPKVEEPGPGFQELSSELANEDASPPASEGDSVMTVLQVDSAAARYDDSAAPPYPPKMLEKRIEGSVGIQYVVDTTGRADTTSVVILSATHEEFASSVKKTLPLMHFRPAVMSGRKVRQLVQQLFAFRIDTSMIAQQRKPERP